CNVNPEDEQFMMEKYNQHRNVGVVKSARGGLHIYCNMGPYKLQQNSMVNVIVTKDFSVDVFACVDAMSDRLMDEKIDVEDRNKTRRIVQSGTQIQKYRDSKRKPLNLEIIQKLQTGELRNSILTYQDLNNAYEKTNLAEIQDVFLILGFDIKVIQRDDETAQARRYEVEKLEKIEERKSCLEKCEMSKKQAEILVHWLDYTIIHTNHPHAEGELRIYQEVQARILYITIYSKKGVLAQFMARSINGRIEWFCGKQVDNSIEDYQLNLGKMKLKMMLRDRHLGQAAKPGGLEGVGLGVVRNLGI
ncbi:MAG: hypothetical protein EZS28_033178, partial [Streblomastix strix]